MEFAQLDQLTLLGDGVLVLYLVENILGQQDLASLGDGGKTGCHVDRGAQELHSAGDGITCRSRGPPVGSHTHSQTLKHEAVLVVSFLCGGLVVEKRGRPLGLEEDLLHCTAPGDGLAGLLECNAEGTFTPDASLVQHQCHLVATILLHLLSQDAVVQFGGLKMELGGFFFLVKRDNFRYTSFMAAGLASQRPAAL